jgi:predicted exporter
MMHGKWSVRTRALVLWLAGLLLCGFVVLQARFTADLSAFLPQTPTPEQKVLLDQLRDGVVSRLILVGIEGGDMASRAGVSKAMAQRLRGEAALASVSNGEPVNAERDQRFLFGNRYLLSPAVTPARFTVDGLHAALADTIDLLASPAGMLAKPLLPRDPTGETVLLLERLATGNRPRESHGVWVSRTGAGALLLVQTRAAAVDTDGQQQAMQQIRAAFEAARGEVPVAGELTLLMTGPGVFSVQSRQTIQTEVERLSAISAGIIIGMLLLLYRSPWALALGLVPVLSGALAGVAAVSLGSGVVHGITLGFGATLIGEAVDYSIYLFVQSRTMAARKGVADADVQRAWVRDFWPTIRLGMLTSIVGFSALLLSSFPGLSQLGLYSIAGLVVAAAVTRFILPHLLPANFRIRDISALGHAVGAAAQRAPLLRIPMALVVLAACVVVFLHRGALWNTELSSLSPVSQADQALDARLRADMGAPDVRYMVAVTGGDREAALAASEKVALQLEPLVAQGVLAGYESASRYLPSMATQRQRQASLPADGLAQRLADASAGLPVRPALFAPFIDDVAAARARQPLQRADLDGTSFAIAVDSLMFERDGRWHALLPLTAPSGISGTSETSGAGIAADAVRAALARAAEPSALFVDLKAESDNLYSGYLNEAVLLSGGGLVAILVLLGSMLRSPRRALRVLLPLFAAVVSVVALLAATGQRMTILHLVGLLLICAVGSNYALFFDRPQDEAAEPIAPETLASMLFANLTTVAGFGVLGFSEVPVLQAIGRTVGPGAILALIYAAAFARGGRR